MLLEKCASDRQFNLQRPNYWTAAWLRSCWNIASVPLIHLMGATYLRGKNVHITQLVLATSEGDGGMVQHDAAFWCLRENFERQ